MTPELTALSEAWADGVALWLTDGAIQADPEPSAALMVELGSVAGGLLPWLASPFVVDVGEAWPGELQGDFLTRASWLHSEGAEPDVAARLAWYEAVAPGVRTDLETLLRLLEMEMELTLPDGTTVYIVSDPTGLPRRELTVSSALALVETKATLVTAFGPGVTGPRFSTDAARRAA